MKFVCFSLFFFVVLVVPLHDLEAQQKGKLRGTVQESGKASPLPFATVGVYTQKDSLVGGGIADEKGDFEVDLPLGTFYALVEFMGFEALKSSAFTLSSKQNAVDLGTISLQSSTADLDEVVVQGEKTLMELSLDKRIFNVGKDLANAGGNASDILMNLPSVEIGRASCRERV